MDGLLLEEFPYKGGGIIGTDYPDEEYSGAPKHNGKESLHPFKKVSRKTHGRGREGAH